MMDRSWQGGPPDSSGGKENSHIRYLKTLVVIIVVVTFAAVLVPRNSIEVDVGDVSLQIRGISGNVLSHATISSAEISFAEIAHMELVEMRAYGEMLDGYAGRQMLGPRCDMGIWRWEDFGGEYQLLIREDAKCAILLETVEGSYILFNCESTDFTQALYEALVDYMAELSV